MCTADINQYVSIAVEMCQIIPSESLLIHMCLTDAYHFSAKAI